MAGEAEIRGGMARGGSAGGSNLEAKTRNVVTMFFAPIAGFFGGLSTINRYKLTAILIWLIGVYATSLIVESASVNGVNSSAVSGITVGIYGIPFFAAFFVQYIFTTIESPIFARKEVNWLNLLTIVIDTLINYAVASPIVNGMMYGNVWRSLEDIVYKLTGNQLGNQDMISTILTITVSFGIAAAPEMLWNWGKRG